VQVRELISTKNQRNQRNQRKKSNYSDPFDWTPLIAAGAETSFLTGKSHQLLMVTALAANSQKTMFQKTAF
jgi:hypothetical protein